MHCARLPRPVNDPCATHWQVECGWDLNSGKLDIHGTHAPDSKQVHYAREMLREAHYYARAQPGFAGLGRPPELQQMLAKLAPELALQVAHGSLKTALDNKQLQAESNGDKEPKGGIGAQHSKS